MTLRYLDFGRASPFFEQKRRPQVESRETLKKRVHRAFKRSKVIGRRYFDLNYKFFTLLFMFYHQLHVLKDDFASESVNVFYICIVTFSLPNSRTKISLSRTPAFPRDLQRNSTAWDLVQKTVCSAYNHDGGCVNSLLLSTKVIITVILNVVRRFIRSSAEHFPLTFQDSIEQKYRDRVTMLTKLAFELISGIVVVLCTIFTVYKSFARA